MARRRGVELALGAAVILVVVAVGLAGAPATRAASRVQRAATPGTAQTPIEHVVFIQKENRSFDEYFGLLPGVKGTDTATCWTNSGARVISPMPATPDPMPQDISHAASTWITAYDHGAMDGFCHERGAIVQGTGQDLADSQMRGAQIPNYWAYARKYGIGDRMFAGWRGASFANNVFAQAAQTGRYESAIAHEAIYGNPVTPETGPTYTWGCDDSIGTTVDMLRVDGTFDQRYPCFPFRAIPNLLDDAGLTWKMYSNQDETQFVHSGLAAIRSIRCHGGEQPPCPADDPYWAGHVVRAGKIFTAAQAGNLPNVTWYLGKETEHAPKSACRGEDQTVRLVNAIMSGPQWGSSAIVIWWDEWGGFYDHVKPPRAFGPAGINANVSYGFRVPLLVISPWIRRGALGNGGYVSHAFYSHPSFARFVEKLWALPSLGAGDDPSTYDATKEPVPGTLMDFFDFSSAIPPADALLLREHICATLSLAQRHEVAISDPD